MVAQLANNELMEAQIEALRRDSLNMRRELDRKEAVIVRQIGYTKANRALFDSCQSVSADKTTLIEKQRVD
jgi:hypothetical protein